MSEDRSQRRHAGPQHHHRVHPVEIDASQCAFGTRGGKIVDRMKLAGRIERAGDGGDFKAVRAPIGDARLGQIGRIGRDEPDPARAEAPQRFRDRAAGG